MIDQGIEAGFIVAVDPTQDRLVLPADVSGAGGGIEPPGGDQIQRLEPLTAPGMRGVD